jgi:hypothetical protein
MGERVVGTPPHLKREGAEGSQEERKEQVGKGKATKGKTPG